MLKAIFIIPGIKTQVSSISMQENHAFTMVSHVYQNVSLVVNTLQIL